MSDYERINFNIKKDLLVVVDEYCSNGYGRSALLNYLLAMAIESPQATELKEVLERRKKS